MAYQPQQKKKNFFSCYDYDGEPEHKMKFKPQKCPIQYVEPIYQQAPTNYYSQAPQANLPQMQPILSNSIHYSQLPPQILPQSEIIQTNNFITPQQIQPSTQIYQQGLQSLPQPQIYQQGLQSLPQPQIYQQGLQSLPQPQIYQSGLQSLPQTYQPQLSQQQVQYAQQPIKSSFKMSQPNYANPQQVTYQQGPVISQMPFQPNNFPQPLANSLVAQPQFQQTAQFQY